MAKLSQKTKLIIIAVVIFIDMAAIFGFVLYKKIEKPTPQHVVEWTGLWKDLNFRDIGISINKCLGSKVFKEQILLRSNRYFSGWSCNTVGSPEKIYSLNFEPQQPAVYYCNNAQGNIVSGSSFNDDFIIENIENLENWNIPKFRTAVCQTIREALFDITENRRILLHCHAGRDRTGAISAILVAVLAEQKGKLNSTMIAAIECDYEKTKSLEPEKKGRMQSFILALQRQGIQNFLQTKCNISPDLLNSSASSFVLAQ